MIKSYRIQADDPKQLDEGIKKLKLNEMDIINIHPMMSPVQSRITGTSSMTTIFWVFVRAPEPITESVPEKQG